MKVAGLGQCSLDYLCVVVGFPREDSKNEIIEWDIQGGGPVATALVALTRLGVDTCFMGVVSDDEAGGLIRQGLIEEGVLIEHLLVRKGGKSQTAFIIVNRQSGKRTILWQRPTVTSIRPKEVKRTFLEGADLMLLDGLMCEASIEAAKMSKKKGIPVMLDAGRVREGMFQIAESSDYIVASEEFGRELAGTPVKALKELMRFKPKAVTITLGNKGSITMSGNDSFLQPAFDVEVVDTTGAGDVFHGGYIYGILNRWNIRETVRFASAYAALKCRRLGGRAGISDYKETIRFMTETENIGLKLTHS